MIRQLYIILSGLLLIFSCAQEDKKNLFLESPDHRIKLDFEDGPDGGFLIQFAWTINW